MTYPQGPYGPPPHDPYSAGSPPTSGAPYPQPYSGQPYSGAPAPYAPPQPAYGPVGMMPPPTTGPRPQGVTGAAMLMVFTVVLSLTAGAMILTGVSDMADAIGRQVVTYAVFCLLIAMTFMGLTVGVLRGRNGARIAAFVMYGVFMLFNGCMGAIIGVFINVESGAPWQAHTFTYIMIALFVIDIIVIVLLALGESARWFQSMTAARNAGLLN